MGVINEIIEFLNSQEIEIPKIFTLETIMQILDFIMLSKLMHPEIFVDEQWIETWEHFDELPELEQQYILKLRTLCHLFDDKNILIN